MCHIVAVIFIWLCPVFAIVPPKTPVLTGFDAAPIGSDRELVCDASQPDAGKVTYKWYKYSTDNSVENWEGKGPIGTSEKYVFSPVTETGVFNHENHGSTVHPVSGKYKCRASNVAGTRDSEWRDLYVYQPCSLYSVNVSHAEPLIGSTFILNCNIPNPTGYGGVMWSRKPDSVSLRSDVAVANSKGCHAPDEKRYTWTSSCSPPSSTSKSKTFNLQVTNAQIQDSAYWSCRDIGLKCISNPVRTVVQAPPGTPNITGFPSGPFILDTNNTELNLKCEASPVGDTYDWYKDGTKLSTSLTYDFEVKKERSEGIYSCVARNTAGSSESNNNTLVVYYKTDSVVVSPDKASVQAGANATFTCSAAGGRPIPTLKIYIERPGGTPEEVTQGQERVMNKEDNQAEYYCEAKVPGYPELDMTSSRRTYKVTFPNTKVAFVNDPTRGVDEGQVKTFQCETDSSNPTTILSWHKKSSGSHVWQDLITGINSSETMGTFGGKIKKSVLSLTTTRAMDGWTIRCRSSYLLKGHEFFSNVDATMRVYFKSKARWNDHYPKLLTVAVNPSDRVTFVLHVIVYPPPSITWLNPRNQPAAEENFVPAKVNDTTYTLSKMVIQTSDYGNYTARVENDMGTSLFVFQLRRKGPPSTPCCLQKVNRTAVSLTLAFTSSFNGGSKQTFRLVYKTLYSDWTNGGITKEAEDRGFDRQVLMKVTNLTSNTEYHFQVKSSNEFGLSPFGEILRLETEVAPSSTLTIRRTNDTVKATWTKLKREYTKVQIKFCLDSESTPVCTYHIIKNVTKGETDLLVEEPRSYLYYLEVFDGPDLVYQSSPVRLQSTVPGPSTTATTPSYASGDTTPSYASGDVGHRNDVDITMIAAVVGAAILSIAVVVTVVVVMRRRNMGCFSAKGQPREAPKLDTEFEVQDIPQRNPVDPDESEYMYACVGEENSAFEDNEASTDESGYLTAITKVGCGVSKDENLDGYECPNPPDLPRPERVEEVIYDDAKLEPAYSTVLELSNPDASIKIEDAGKCGKTKIAHEALNKTPHVAAEEIYHEVQ